MAKRTRRWREPRTLDDESAPTVSLRQVVAYNVAEGRRKRGWTQAELGERLGQVTGKPWSVASISAAESGWDGTSGRLRSFDVNDVLAFAIALELPITWFLLPPPVSPEGEEVGVEARWIRVGGKVDGLAAAITGDFLAWLVTATKDDGDPDGVMRQRMRRLRGSDQSGLTEQDQIWVSWTALKAFVEENGERPR